MITAAKFQGHGASVLCLDVSSTTTSSLLLSGSEDGTARLWDLRDHRRRACLCIRVPGGGDVLSAVFAPPAVDATAATMANEKQEAPFSRDCTVFLGVENRVLEYDLRHADSPILSSDPTRDWGKVLQNQDEVNQIGLVYYSKPKSNNSSGNSKKKKKKGGGNKKKQQSSDQDKGSSLYLAACDDAGKARWTEAWPSSSREEASGSSGRYENHASSTILHHDNHGVAVVPACAFRPIHTNSHKRGGGGGGPSLEFVTGGTDCKIQLWDIFRPKKPISTVLTNQSNNEDEQSKPQVCNPPFVYSLAWSNDGKTLSAGLGDGTVGVFEINNRTLVQRQLLVGTEATDGTMDYAHQSSVASVVYPSFSAPTSDRILCSAGSDGAVVFWDLGRPNDEEWDDIETTMGGDKHNKNNSEIDNEENTEDAVGQLFPPRLLRGLCNHDTTTMNNAAATETPSTHKPRILFNIPHGEKINWVTQSAPSSGTASSAYNDTIFVADTSPDITSYTIPF